MNVRTEELGQLSQAFQSFQRVGTELSPVDQPADLGSRVVGAADPSGQREHDFGRVFDCQLGAIHRRPPAVQAGILLRLFEESSGQLEPVSCLLATGYKTSSHSNDESVPGGSRQCQIRSRPSFSRRNPLRRISSLKSRNRPAMYSSVS